MTDRSSAIFASLDRFIERLGHPHESISGHGLATQYQPTSLANPLTNHGNNRSGHCGHPRQETFGADREGCDAYPTPVENPDADLTRKVLSVDGYSGKRGKPLCNQRVAGRHRGEVDGYSGKSLSDRQLANRLKGARDQAGSEASAPADAPRVDPIIWGDLYAERAAHRQFDGDYPRVEAELLAWREIQWRWHLAHRERISAEICAGCDQYIQADRALDLIDGARVHMGNHCRIAYEQRWRAKATVGLQALGLDPPVASCT
jgi:hypothetical protein